MFSDPLALAEALRMKATPELARERRVELGQFLTPAPVASLLASFAACERTNVSILDPGAGVGSLFAALVSRLCRRATLPQSIHITAYEIDPILAEYANQTMHACEHLCRISGVQFSGEVKQTEFLGEAVRLLETNLSQVTPLIEGDIQRPNCVIQNPPYRKIHSASEPRRLARRMGLETTNLYTAFLFAAARLLGAEGEMVAVTPRSFCSGPYFRAFRETFLKNMSLQRLHLFETRREAFRSDGVLQETLILHAVRASPPETVTFSSGVTADEDFLWREAPYSEVVRPDDPEHLIRIVPDDTARQIVEGMARFTTPLTALRLTVSTGRVVDFRASAYLRRLPGKDTVPLIWPYHLNGRSRLERGPYVRWPGPESLKPVALATCRETESLLVPDGNYVLVKRFSAKEQTKRVVAAVYESARIPQAATGVGFENHLNYFHCDGAGMGLMLARGLALFLNSTLVDEFFRLSSGHTQVNATDLRALCYPAAEALHTLGAMAGDFFLDQDAVDELVERVLMENETQDSVTLVRKQIDNALVVLSSLGLPLAQRNERSALTLLALLNLKPGQDWAESDKPLLGITPIMQFAATHYGKTYAPNTRETIRRSTVHQFLDAGLLVANPDKEDRPINSPHTVYQVESTALQLIQAFGTLEWEEALRVYLTSIQTLKDRYDQKRQMLRIPIQINSNEAVTLSPGGQNVLIERVIADFCPHYLPGGMLLYLGDADEKFGYFDRSGLAALGVAVDGHGKMPDVIVHHVQKDWLVLIEAVTSHGPVNPKRHAELKHLFRDSTAGLVFVTAFLTRKAFTKYAADVSWETEVWLADAPAHLIHYNGERFLGPY